MVSRGFSGFFAGVGAGAVALLVSLALRWSTGGGFLPEMGARLLFSLVPGTLESGAVETLGELAKYTTFAAATAVTLALYGVIGLILSRSLSFSRARRGEVIAGYSVVAYAAMTLIGVAVLWSTRIGPSTLSFPAVLLSFIPPQVCFALVLYGLHAQVPTKPTEICRAVSPPPGKTYDRRRRLFIKAGAAGAVATALLLYGVGFLLSGPVRPSTASDAGLFANEVTATSDFYRVDIDIVTPGLSSSSWRLSVSGLVDTPLSLSLDDLLRMDVQEQYNTLECVSNQIGGDLISTAKWRGVRLRDVLQMAGLRPSAEYIVFRASDGYDVGIPADRALLDATLLAFEMNGSPLPGDHGYPLRAVVPGLYGMMNAKWITSIEAVSGTYEGYWQRRGWTNDARYQTGSSIVVPGGAALKDRFVGVQGSDSVLNGVVPVAGIAFAGDRGISKVEVSTDGGKTWTQASEKDPLSPYTWVLWSTDWNPTSDGRYALVVRATDGQGKTQTAVVTNPFPDGATGYHVVDVSVVSS